MGAFVPLFFLVLLGRLDTRQRKARSGRKQPPDCCGDGCSSWLPVPPDREQVEHQAVAVVRHVPGPGGR